MTDVPRETSIEVVAHDNHHVARRASMFEMDPEAQIAYASKIATSLCNVIDKQHLYTDLGGKKHVRVEGWQVLGTFLGVLSKERTVTELADGSYEAFVDLIRVNDGTVIGGASSICGMDEKRWSKADKYARRSMAITRATGKAYRTNFSWLISLAGYEVTPAEEMPHRGPRGEEEIYTEAPAQKKKLAEYAAESGVTEKAALQEISSALLRHAVPIRTLRQEVKAYIDMPFKS